MCLPLIASFEIHFAFRPPKAKNRRGDVGRALKEAMAWGPIGNKLQEATADLLLFVFFGLCFFWCFKGV